jgi:hypothetical protein
MLCDRTQCVAVASRIVNGEYLCESCFVNHLNKGLVKPNKKITVEFCMWLQDTEVFEMFVNHLNKGLKIENLKKAKGAGR